MTRPAHDRAGRRAALRSMGALCLLLGGRELAFGAAIVAVRLWPASDVDLYLARQENSRGEPARVNALGITVKLYR